MILNFKRGAQVLGKKIADLDAGGAQPASAASQAETSPASSAAFQPALAASQAEASKPGEFDDWRELLVQLLANAPDDVASKLVNCLDRETLVKALEKRSDPYLKVALLLLKK